MGIFPFIRFSLRARVDHASAAASIIFKDNAGTTVPFTPAFENGDSTVLIQPSAALKHLTSYIVQAATNLNDRAGDKLSSTGLLHFLTSLDSADKFPRVSDSPLLARVQNQTLTYFWDFSRPVSWLAR